MTNIEKIESILRHMKMVESNMQRLAKNIYNDRPELALQLLIRSRKHDLSKFTQLEFDHLFDNDKLFSTALLHHQTNNDHHPEYHGSIHRMPEVAVAEMVCDCAARGQEFGTDVRQWFEEAATVKYKFKMTDPVGVLINKYLDSVLTMKFAS